MTICRFLMPYPIVSKIFTSLSIVLTLATVPTVHAAFWAQQQVSTNTVVNPPTNPASTPVKPASVAKIVKKPTKPVAKPVVSPTFDAVLKQTDQLVEHESYSQAIKVWQHFLRSKNVTHCQTIYANYSLGKLYIKPQQYELALNAFNKVLASDPLSYCSNVDYTMADTLDSKGYVLVKLGHETEALDYFKLVPKLYKNTKSSDVAELVLSALSNTAEVSLVTGNKAQALDYAKRAKKLAPNNDESYAIMSFLLWLMNNKTEQEALKAIHNLAPDTEYSWDWRDIPPVIQQLPAKRQAKANCFIDFFDKHHDKARVKACVAQY